jgi:hypothetical protein
MLIIQTQEVVSVGPAQYLLRPKANLKKATNIKILDFFIINNNHIFL